MSDYELLLIAIEQFGKRGLSRKLGMSEAAIYLAKNEGRGLRPVYMQKIKEFLSATSPQQANTRKNTESMPEVPQNANKSISANVTLQALLVQCADLTDAEAQEVLLHVLTLKSNRKI